MIGCALFAEVLAPLTGPLSLTHPLMLFVLNLPSLTGLGIYAYIGGWSGLSGILKKLIPRQQDWKWFPILLMLFMGFAWCMRLGSLLLGVAVPVITDTPMQMVSKALQNVMEEIALIGGIFGWIGFVLPFLQGKFKRNIPSALLTGLLFGLWVMPGYGLSSVATATSYMLYVLQLMAFISFASYIFNATAGNLSCYLFAFWLAASGSHIQLYYFNIPVQTMELVFLTLAAMVMHGLCKQGKLRTSLQIFPYFIEEKCSVRYDF